MKPSIEELRSLLRYDAETGKLFWRERQEKMFEGLRSTWRCRKWNGHFAGKEAGHLCKSGNMKGYRVVRILSRAYFAHRVVWALVHGAWPIGEIDHRFGKESGDRIDNLRIATRSQNGSNSKKRKDNTSGFKGVSWDSINKKWVVRIRAPEGRYENLGRFDDAKKGHLVYCKRAVELYGEFARFN